MARRWEVFTDDVGSSERAENNEGTNKHASVAATLHSGGTRCSWFRTRGQPGGEMLGDIYDDVGSNRAENNAQTYVDAPVLNPSGPGAHP